jgi:2-polyprenyl-3-methyl-5-hydroxy-6-metoxy-1,4-benzoquinol methylase
MTTDSAAVERGLKSHGESDAPIYRAAAKMLQARRARGIVVDVGCGIGRFLEYAGEVASDYIGVDVVRHPGLSPDAEFHRADLDYEPIPLPDDSADIVVALETIEHLESPRSFCRELARVLKPGGWLVLSTPNQLSLLSLLCLIVRGRFVAFQDAYYPVHRTALLPIDLVRLMDESGLSDAELGYSCVGRIPLTGAHYPETLSQMFPQALSDNVLVAARKHA